jgi:hypothetical protein
VFDKLILVLVFGCGCRRLADHTCSATTLRRRRDEWIALGLTEQLRCAALGAYDRLFGLELEHLAVDGCITKSPCGGQIAGYDYQPCRQVLSERSMVGQIATRGQPAPVQASRRWPVERPTRGPTSTAAALVHRTLQGGGRVLAGAGQRRHRLRPAGPPRLGPLSLGQPTPPPLITYWRMP